MEDCTTDMYSLLDELSNHELKRFKGYLSSKLLESYKPIPEGKLENADVTDTVTLMKQHYSTENMLNITVLILKKLPRLDLIDSLKSIRCLSRDSPATLIEEHVGTSSLEADSTTKSVSPKWVCHSKRWQPHLQKLINSNTVKRVGPLIFHEEFLIAHGSQGTGIYLGLREDGTEVAIKRVVKTNFKEMQAELRILQDPGLDSPYIVRYLDSMVDEHFGYIVLQLCEYSLDEYLRLGLPEGSESQLKRMAQEVLMGLQVLHNARRIHRDIKPHNVLIDVSGVARLADFGLSRRLDLDQTTVSTNRAGTQCWEAAEILEAAEKLEAAEIQEADETTDQHLKYKRSTDIQVAGMLVYYILTKGKHHPFGKNPHDPRCQGNILDGRFTLEKITDEEAKDLIGQMIHRDPKQRPSVEKCLHHVYFSGGIRALHPPGNNDSQDTLKIDVSEGGATGHRKRRHEEDTHSDSEEFFTYQMTARPRGFCVIINNISFRNFMGSRRGTHKDVAALSDVFTWLCFEVCLFQDLTAQEMRNTLETFRTRDHGDCFVCCVLSHMEGSRVVGSDENALEVNDLLALFSTSNCPGLIGKPKVFFLTECQTGLSLPCSDFLCSYINGMAVRNTEKGTYFIQVLCSQLRKHCPRGEDVVKILTHVKKEVLETKLNLPPNLHGHYPQLVEHRDTLLKTLTFPVPEPKTAEKN